LVLDFGQRLAARLGLPFVAALRKRGSNPPQKEMQNSAMQLRNLLKAFEVVAAQAESEADGGVLQRVARQLGSAFGPAPVLSPAPVLLVDDVVDSRWTMTLAAILLQDHGSGPVYPLALARASLRGG